MQDNRIYDTFEKMIRIDSESKEEGNFHKYLIEVFDSLGMEVIQDDSMKDTGLGANNLIGKLRGNTDAEPLFFSCHTDTVSPGKNIVPVYKDDGNIYSEGDTILAADNKAGIAILVEAIRRIKEKNLPCGTIELVLFPGEEIGLIGSAAFDASLMESDYGFVLDSAGPVGNMVVGSPNLFAVDYEITGKAAHAGLEPENGVSAIQIAAKAIARMKLGRLDDETTANIGVIDGGVAKNIVPEKVKVEGEVRSISDEKAENQLKEMLSYMEEAASELGGSVTYEEKLLSKGYHLNEENKTVKLAFAAVEALGRKPVTEIIGGGSDANSLYAKGKEALNLSIGYEKVHTTDEYIPLAEMEKAVELVLNIVAEQAVSSET